MTTIVRHRPYSPTFTQLPPAPIAKPAPAAKTYDPMFGKPPPRTITTSHGATVTFPYQAYKANGIALYGTADLAAVRAFMKGSGYEPITLGNDKAIVTLWVMTYTDTNLGKYQEVVATIAASKVKRDVADKNAYSVLVPATDEKMTSFAYKLVLNTQVAVDVGREQMGLDKALGKVAIVDTPQGKMYEVRDDQDRIVLRGRSTVDNSLTAKLLGFEGLRRNIGLLNTLAAGVRPEVHNDLVTFDISKANQGIVVNPSRSKAATTINPVAATDMLTYGDSPLGRSFAALGFQPRLVYASDQIKIAFDEPIRR